MLRRRGTVKVFVNQTVGFTSQSILDLDNIDLGSANDRDVLSFDAASGNIIPRDIDDVIGTAVIDNGTF